MNIKVQQFCSLATSPSWQAWLYHFSPEIFKRFSKRLQETRGCSQSRSLMVEVLKEVEQAGGGTSLQEFITKYYPHMLVTSKEKNAPRRVARGKIRKGDIFPDFNPNILTFPHRKIFTGIRAELKKQVTAFLLDKIKSDYIITEDKAYVEYLNSEDAAVRDQIPERNWKIAAYRMRNS